MAEWIVGIDEESGFRGDVGATGDTGDQGLVMETVSALEDAAEDAALAPGSAGGELTVGVEAGKFGAGAGAARRAVVGFAGAEDEIGAVGAAVFDGREQLDVVDFRTIRAGNF